MYIFVRQHSKSLKLRVKMVFVRPSVRPSIYICVDSDKQVLLLFLQARSARVTSLSKTKETVMHSSISITNTPLSQKKYECVTCTTS